MSLCDNSDLQNPSVYTGGLFLSIQLDGKQLNLNFSTDRGNDLAYQVKFIFELVHILMSLIKASSDFFKLEVVSYTAFSGIMRYIYCGHLARTTRVL